MATIVDSLVVTLGLDGSGFKQGRAQAKTDLGSMRDDAQRTADQINKIRATSTVQTKAQDAEQIKSLRTVLDAKRKSIKDVERFQKEEIDRNKKQAEGLAAVKDQLIGMLAIFTAGKGLEQFITSTISGEAATGRLADNLGVATEALSTFESMARRVGGTSADGAGAIQSLVTAYQNFRLTGSTGHDQDFNALGINAATLADPAKAMQALAAASERMTKPEFMARMARIGIPPGMVNALELGSKGFADLYAQAQKAGQITEADAKAGQRLTASLADIGDQANKVGRDILTAATPALEGLARALGAIATWAKNNEPIVAAAFYGLAAAAVALSVAIAAPLAPFIAMAAAVVAVGAGVGYLIEKYPALGQAFGELGEDLGPLGDALKGIGDALGKAFHVGNFDALKVFVNWLVDRLHAVSDAIRAVTALLHGDLSGAAKAGKDYLADTFADPRIDPRASRVSAPGAGAAGAGTLGTGAGNRAFSLIAQREGFRSKAYIDNDGRYKVGYGSDTTTDANGNVSAVTAASTATRETAKADLIRRVNALIPVITSQIGPAFAKMTAGAQAALLDLAYNYRGGLSRLPSVVRAAQSGNSTKLAAAIQARSGDNHGVNAGRRAQEAALVSGRPQLVDPGLVTGAQAAASAAYTTVNNNAPITTTATFNGGIILNGVTDARAAASALPAAIRQRGLAVQGNNGLS